MLYLSPNEANLLECSIFHYFVWRNDRQAKDPKYVDTTCVDTRNNYTRIIQVMKEELSHVASMMSETPTFVASSTPEVCFRWMKYATIRNMLVNTEIPRNNNTKRKRDMADETARLATALKSIPEEEITLENAKEVLSTLREEHTEVKKITDSLESKLTKSEKIYSELLKFNNKKLRLEKRITNLKASEEATTTEQNILDDQHDVVTDMKDGEGGDQEPIDVREKLETKKRRLQLQETMYANAILYEAQHEKEQQKVTINGHKIIDFESRIQELLEFKREFGHCQVGMKTHRSLHFWLMKVRKYYRLKTPALTPERIAKLDALGVVWDVADGNKQKTFNSYVEQCRDFKEKHGHLRIPLLTGSNEDGIEPTNDDIRLRIWAQLMRQKYHKKFVIRSKTNLDKERIAALDSIGFQWSIDVTSAEGGSNIDVENLTSRDMMFRTRIEQLRKVKEIHGNCNERKNIFSVYPNNIALIKWIKEQRAQMRFLLSGKRSRLTEERQEMLRSIEFDYNPRSSSIQPTTQKKKRPTKMEILALEIQEKKINNHHDSENNISDYEDSDIDE